MTTEPRIPGVKYRVETRTRQVPEDVMGDTVMVDEEYTTDIPVPPRDWDRIILRFVIGAAVVTTAVAVVWSTASIGALLALLVHPLIAYGAAITFEAAWITCLAVAWLLRTDPERAKPVNIAGWVALAVVVAAVVSHGAHVHQVVAGVVGGAVSVLAKGLWTVVLRLFSVEFGKGVATWLRMRQQENAAAATLLAQQRRLGGQQAYMAAVYGQDHVTGALATVAGGHVPQLTPGRPDASAPDADTVPAPSGQPSVPDPRPEPEPEPVRTTSEQASAPVPPPAAPLVSIASTVRTILATLPAIEDEQLIDRVKQLHGDRPKLGETVLRYARKIRNAA
jgi:hypothetical protein